MASRDPRLLDAAAARLVAASIHGETVPRAGLDALKIAAQGWKGLHFAEGGGPTLTAGLADSLSRLGHAQAAAGMATAAATLSHAIGYRRASPKPADDTAPLARDLSMLGAVQMMVSPTDALPTLAESIALHGRLAEADPIRWQGPLARGLLCLAVLLAEQDRVAEARATAAELLDIIGPGAYVDVDRDAFLRPLGELVERLAPAHDPDDDARALRARFAGLAGG